MTRTLIALFISCVALAAAAESNPREFANGPAKWLMTGEEQHAWRSVKTDAQANDFIDLFWAQRDPTPGTPRNENRLQFEARVRYADEQFKEGKVRGALTERGRVLILLGYPKGMGKEESKRTAQFQVNNEAGSSDPTGGRALAAREVWEWSHEAALKFNVPKIEVVFIFDGFGGTARRDPQRTDFTMALPGAIKSYIVSPDLTTVPEWAKNSLEKEKAHVVEVEDVQTGPDSIKRVTKRVVIDAPAAVARPASIGRLLLLDDSMALQPQSGSDPFARFSSVAQFKRDRELGWAAEYCAGEILANAPSVKVQLKISQANGDTFSTDPEEFVPDSIKADPGCYLLRGSLPLADVEAGAYKLTIIISGGNMSQSYNLTHDFRIE
jgi:GWxTD domain-containing protein